MVRFTTFIYLLLFGKGHRFKITKIFPRNIPAVYAAAPPRKCRDPSGHVQHKYIIIIIYLLTYLLNNNI